MASETPKASDDTQKTPAKKRDLRPVLAKIGLDMIPVTAGILLALFINSVQENYNDQRLLASTLKSLRDEFSKNKSNIERFLPRQQRFVDSLKFFSEDKSYSIADISESTGPAGTPEIHSTNWRASLNNNSIRLLDFEMVNLLSRIDAKYQELKEQETFIYPVVFGPPMFKKGEEGWEYRKGLEYWMSSYVGNERELLQLYQEFDEMLQIKGY